MDGRELVVTEAEATCPWAFTVSEIRLACSNNGAGVGAIAQRQATATSNAQTYALNGTARRSHPPLDPIWLPNAELRMPGAVIRVNLNPWINAALALCDLPERAAAGQLHVANRLPGCLAKADKDRLTRLAASGDTPAFAAAVNVGVATGTCTIFEVGEAVYRDNAEVLGDICLRRTGETRCWWSPRNTVQ